MPDNKGTFGNAHPLLPCATEVTFTPDSTRSEPCPPLDAPTLVTSSWCGACGSRPVRKNSRVGAVKLKVERAESVSGVPWSRDILYEPESGVVSPDRATDVPTERTDQKA